MVSAFRRRIDRGGILLALHRWLLTALLACVATTSALAQTSDASARLAATAAEALTDHRYADAERAFVQLRDLNPAVAEIHANLAFAYYQQGKFKEAADALRQALKLKPSLPNASSLLAMSLSELGRFEEALPGLERAFKQSTDKALHRAAGLQLQRAYTGETKRPSRHSKIEVMSDGAYEWIVAGFRPLARLLRPRTQRNSVDSFALEFVVPSYATQHVTLTVAHSIWDVLSKYVVPTDSGLELATAAGGQ